MARTEREQIRADLRRALLLLGLLVVVLGGSATILVRARAAGHARGHDWGTKFHLGSMIHCVDMRQHLLEMERELADAPPQQADADAQDQTNLALAEEHLEAIAQLQERFEHAAVSNATRRLHEAYDALQRFFKQRSVPRTAPVRKALQRTQLRAEQLRRLHHVQYLAMDAELVRETKRWLWQLGGLAGIMLLIGTIVLWRILERSDRAVDSWQRVANERQRLHEALDASFSEAYLVEPDTLRITHANRGAIVALGIDEAAVQSKHFLEVAPELAEADIVAVAAGERRQLMAETHHRRADGSTYPVQLSVQRIEEDGATRLLAVAMDVSDLHEAREALHQAQKVEAAGQIAGGLAHDFNNLIMVIEGHAELLRLQRSTPALRAISEASARAGALTKQLLQFSRKTIVQPVVLDLNDMLTDVKYLLQRLINANIKTRFEPAAEPVPVKADRGQVQQVILNLCINAQDAMPDGGDLTLATGRARRIDGTPGHWEDHAAGDYVFLRVADTGAGIDPDTRKRIFEPFFTTKPVGRGTGLGLASVMAIVTENGGHVAVETEVDEGSCFTVYLPRSKKPASGIHRSSDILSEERGDETILVVDDDDLVADLIEDVLQRKGYRVLVASTPAEALAQVEKHGSTLDLLITDLVMPEMTGYELSQRITAERPDIGVIYISGYAPDRVIPDRRLDEDLTFLQKPFPPRDLVKATRRLLDSRG